MFARVCLIFLQRIYKQRSFLCSFSIFKANYSTQLLTMKTYTLFLASIVQIILPFAMAIPVSPLETRQLGGVRDATSQEISEITFYTALSANSYCPLVIPGGKWICPNCDKTNNLEIVETFTTLLYDTNVLVARGDSEKTIYVVFRGMSLLLDIVHY